MESGTGGSGAEGAIEPRLAEALLVLDAVVGFIAARNRLTADAAEEFGAEARLALLEDDHRVLRRFEGRSSLRAYLLTVFQHRFQDFRRQQWGKWRPSAEALRLGPLALTLEQLVYRDGLSLGEACETLRTNHRTVETPEVLHALFRKLPVRTRRVFEPLEGEGAQELPAQPAAAPDAQLDDKETAARCQALLVVALESLDPADQLLLRLRYENDLTVADIARAQGRDQKALYREIDRLRAVLRARLEAGGLRWADVEGLIERGRCDLRLPPLPKSAAPRTSTEEAAP